MITNFLIKTALATLLFLSPMPMLQASSSDAGTTGAAFLRMGAGARSTGMGETFVGVADDVNAAYFNPAGLANVNGMELTAMRTQWIEGLNYDYGAFAHPTTFGTFAFSAATLTTDDLIKRGNDESDLGTFKNQDAAYALSFGKKITDTFDVGLTARWLEQEIDTASAQTWTGDIGFLKSFEDSPLRMGLAVRHFGQGVKFLEESDPLPMTVDGGISYRFFENRLLLATDVRHVRDIGIKFGLGTEWSQNLTENVRYAIRGGFNNNANDDNGASGLSIGAGIGFKRFALDFAWVPFGDLGNTYRYAAHMKF